MFRLRREVELQSKKVPGNPALFATLLASLLFRFWRAYRADISAGTAVDALLRIDHVDVPFADGIHRALGLAGAASDALFSDLVSHFLHLH